MSSPLSFGFLPFELRWDFDEVAIVPLPDHSARLEALKNRTHPDGFIYPPSQVTKSLPKPWTEEEPKEVPGSRRPALLWPVTASHELHPKEATGAELTADSYSAFLVQALGFLFGYRLQFAEWQHDGRIPFRHSQHPVYVGQQVAEKFLEQASQTWTAWGPDSQRRVVNILYLHCRAPSYEWMWEQFALEYMVTDACFKVMSQLHPLPGGPHGERINRILKHLGAHEGKATVEKIVELRNQLQHEALWAGGRPNYQQDDESHSVTMMHRSLNQRLIAGLLGWRGDYLRSDWTDWRQVQLFE